MNFSSTLWFKHFSSNWSMNLATFTRQNGGQFWNDQKSDISCVQIFQLYTQWTQRTWKHSWSHMKKLHDKCFSERMEHAEFICAPSHSSTCQSSKNERWQTNISFPTTDNYPIAPSSIQKALILVLLVWTRYNQHKNYDIVPSQVSNCNPSVTFQLHTIAVLVMVQSLQEKTQSCDQHALFIPYCNSMESADWDLWCSNNAAACVTINIMPIENISTRHTITFLHPDASCHRSCIVTPLVIEFQSGP